MRGGYALLLGLHAGATITFSRRTVDLPPGVYVYSGSALGPGGVEARIRRHLRSREGGRTSVADKGYHWHIDLPLLAASRMAALGAYCNTRTECRLIRHLKGRGMRVIEGFGSTDCRSGCGGHLLYYGGSGTDLDLSMGRCLEEVKEGFRALGLEPSLIVEF